MTLLLDTHALLWWWSQPSRLSPRVLTLIKDPATTVVVSAASAREIAIKHRSGKLLAGGRILQEWDEWIQVDAFAELSMSSHHARQAGSIPSDHRDPFDRMIAAQGIIHGWPVVSVDSSFGDLGAERMWQ